MLGNRLSLARAATACVVGTAALLLVPLAAWSESSQPDAVSTQPRDGVRAAVRVRYEDLNLSREEGVRALYARLDAAARRACGFYDMRNMRERRAWRSCHETALAGAVERVGLARLSELAEDSRGRGIDPRITAESRASVR